jgi:hypothetical protein
MCTCSGSGPGSLRLAALIAESGGANALRLAGDCVGDVLLPGVLFAIARFGDARADAGKSIISANVYALSLAVYCTSWTFFGSVGRATSGGLSFLTIYLGPTLMLMCVGVILKMIRISKAQRITSIADFIAARYGKSQLLAGLVTVIAVIGVVPYIALQLKAVAASLEVLVDQLVSMLPSGGSIPPCWSPQCLLAFHHSFRHPAP